MGGKSQVIRRGVEKDLYDVRFLPDNVKPNPTREVMLAFLSMDKESALTESDIMEQTKSLRNLCGRIDFLLSHWDRKRMRYWEVLSQIERMVKWHNNAARDLRARADQTVRDREDEKLDAKLRATQPVDNGQ